jgi:hypothetical protein
MSDPNIANLIVPFSRVGLGRIYVAMAGKTQLEPLVARAMPLKE